MLAGGALLLANALDSPAGQSARDEAQPATPGPVAGSTGGLGQLPPLAMVLDHQLPGGVADLPPIQQAQRLRELAAAAPSATRSVELGSVLQLLGDSAGAERAFRDALAREPGDVGALVGLALVNGVTGPGGLPEATRQLRALARQHPRDQIVSFNQGWLEIYRRRAGPARAAWRRTVELGPDTRLGRTASALLATLGTGSSGRNP